MEQHSSIKSVQGKANIGNECITHSVRQRAQVLKVVLIVQTEIVFNFVNILPLKFSYQDVLYRPNAHFRSPVQTPLLWIEAVISSFGQH